MIDEYLNKGKVTASVLWAVVVGLMALGWVVILVAPGHWKVAGMFAATSCATSALAAVLHIRCYMVRLAGLVRAVGSIQHEGAPSPVRRI